MPNIWKVFTFEILEKLKLDFERSQLWNFNFFGKVLTKMASLAPALNLRDCYLILFAFCLDQSKENTCGSDARIPAGHCDIYCQEH